MADNKGKKEKIIAIIVGLGLLAILIWLVFGGGGKEEEVEERVEPSPTPTEAPYSSRTGALWISPTEKETKEIEAIKKLRELTPINTGDFEIEFDYEISKFRVKTTKSEEEFKEWLINNGYEDIPMDYFVVEK